MSSFAIARETLPRPSPLNPVTLIDEQGDYALGLHLAILEDPGMTLTLEDVMRPEHAQRFLPSTREVPGFGFSQSAFWVKVDVERRTTREEVWLLEFGYAPMQFIDVYTVDASGKHARQRGGMGVPVGQRPYLHNKHIFELNFTPGATTTLYLRVAGESSKNIPLRLYRADVFAQAAVRETAMLAVYAGIMIAMFCYNLFIYLSIREPAYLYYMLFLVGFSAGLLSLNGVVQFIFTPNQPLIGGVLTAFFAGVSGLFSGLFTMRFLNTREQLPWLHWLMRIGILWGVIACVAPWVVSYHHSVITSAALLVAFPVLFLFAAITAVARGSVTARYYLLAWCMLSLGVILKGMSLFGVVSSNIFTDYAILWGSAAEAVLLAVALAARMRDMKEDKERAEAEHLRAQKAMLAAKAEAANAQAQAIANQQLALANHHKALEQQALTLEKEKQLIEKEKLANLGLLSAGVAHEINNPNHFLSISAQTAEVRLRDLQSFVGELMGDEPDRDIAAAFGERFGSVFSQLTLVKEGSERIAGIVKGMRSASRVDDGEAIVFDPVESLLATLMLIKPTFKTVATFDTKGLQAGHSVKGFPSQLNQVFTNLIVNGCQAIEEKQKRSAQVDLGEICLSSHVQQGELTITIQDSGLGMSEAVKVKLFQPFFTTKGSDKGTGLGLSICKDIITAHGGRIEVESTEGVGTKFNLVLPLQGNF